MKREDFMKLVAAGTITPFVASTTACSNSSSSSEANKADVNYKSPTVQEFNKNLELPGNVLATIIDLKNSSIMKSSSINYVKVLGYHTPGDGGGGEFYWDSDSTATSNSGTIFEPDFKNFNGTGRWLRIIDNPVDLLHFGIILDTPSAAKANTQTLINLSESNFKSFYCTREGDIFVEGDITFKNIKKFELTSNSRLINTRASTTIEFRNCVTSYIRVNTEKKEQQWYNSSNTGNLGTDKQSIGVLITNCYDCEIHINSVRNYYYGIVFYGNDSGCSYNSLYAQSIRENFTNLKFKKDGDGFNNENKIFGGRYRISSSFANAKGSTLIDLGRTNNNTFYSPTLEGENQDRTVYINGPYNVFINPRIELIPANSFIFDNSASHNLVLGGYGNDGIQGKNKAFTDNGRFNVVISTSGTRFSSSPEQPMQVKGEANASQPLYEFMNSKEQTKIRMLANGNIETYTGDGYKPDDGKSFPSLLLNNTTGALAFGSNQRDIKPIDAFRMYNQTRFEMVHPHMHIKNGRITYKSSAFENGAQTPNVSQGNLFMCENSNSTRISYFSSGFNGQHITVKCDGNTLIEHNEKAIVTKNKSDLKPSRNQIIEFVNIDNIWYQK